jgi:hypothetical protein
LRNTPQNLERINNIFKLVTQWKNQHWPVKET